MTDVYILRNQHDLYLSKQGEWVDGSDQHQIYRTLYRDDAINTKVELSVRDPLTRLTLVVGALDERGQLKLEHSPTPSDEAPVNAPQPDPCF